MNSGIRRVGAGMIVLFVALVGQLTYLQVWRAESLAEDPSNIRIFIRDIARPRGPILTADGEIVARSLDTGDELKQQRTYPLDSLFAHVAGYQSIVYGNTGVEAAYNDELVGRDIAISLRSIDQVIRGYDPEGTVVLTLSLAAQEAARDALRGQAGSIVVLDVRSGAVVAMYSEPTYDPNALASHDVEEVQAVRKILEAHPGNPELARAWRERYPAGSTFKVITTAVALDNNVTTPDTEYPVLSEIVPPQTTRPIQNFGGKACGGTLAESFRDSCNTTFAQIGLDLGERFAEGVERFGINTSPPDADVNPTVVESIGPVRGAFDLDKPSFAQAAIGQGPVAVTPLEMALVAASVANDGMMMVPHVAAEIRDADGVVTERIEPEEWRRAMSVAAAGQLTTLMRDVVDNGTGRSAAIPGIPVAGKTGTAQAPVGANHAWFIGFAPADDPVYAIAVLVEHGGELGDDATGGRVAAPMARDVLSRLLQG
ncbi:MAG: penicillin-binding protein 2 [Acidimicrobiia bacterium]|nr:penicillin-binding protein 2 [Acidimicrobiia bacterium]